MGDTESELGPEIELEDLDIRPTDRVTFSEDGKTFHEFKENALTVTHREDSNTDAHEMPTPRGLQHQCVLTGTKAIR